MMVLFGVRTEGNLASGQRFVDKEYVPRAAYQGDLTKVTYAQNSKLMFQEMSEKVRPSKYHQMIKYKKGLLKPFKFHTVIQDCAVLDELIQRAKRWKRSLS